MQGEPARSTSGEAQQLHVYVNPEMQMHGDDFFMEDDIEEELERVGRYIEKPFVAEQRQREEDELYGTLREENEEVMDAGLVTNIDDLLSLDSESEHSGVNKRAANSINHYNTGVRRSPIGDTDTQLTPAGDMTTQLTSVNESHSHHVMDSGISSEHRVDFDSSLSMLTDSKASRGISDLTASHPRKEEEDVDLPSSRHTALSPDTDGVDLSQELDSTTVSPDMDSTTDAITSITEDFTTNDTDLDVDDVVDDDDDDDGVSLTLSTASDLLDSSPDSPPPPALPDSPPPPLPTSPPPPPPSSMLEYEASPVTQHEPAVAPLPAPLAQECGEVGGNVSSRVGGDVQSSVEDVWAYEPPRTAPCDSGDTVKDVTHATNISNTLQQHSTVAEQQQQQVQQPTATPLTGSEEHLPSPADDNEQIIDKCMKDIQHLGAVDSFESPNSYVMDNTGKIECGGDMKEEVIVAQKRVVDKSYSTILETYFGSVGVENGDAVVPIEQDKQALVAHKMEELENAYNSRFGRNVDEQMIKPQKRENVFASSSANVYNEDTENSVEEDIIQPVVQKIVLYSAPSAVRSKLDTTLTMNPLLVKPQMVSTNNDIVQHLLGMETLESLSNSDDSYEEIIEPPIEFSTKTDYEGAMYGEHMRENIIDKDTKKDLSGSDQMQTNSISDKNVFVCDSEHHRDNGDEDVSDIVVSDIDDSSNGSGDPPSLPMSAPPPPPTSAPPPVPTPADIEVQEELIQPAVSAKDNASLKLVSSEAPSDSMNVSISSSAPCVTPKPPQRPPSEEQGNSVHEDSSRIRKPTIGSSFTLPRIPPPVKLSSLPPVKSLSLSKSKSYSTSNLSATNRPFHSSLSSSVASSLRSSLSSSSDNLSVGGSLGGGGGDGGGVVARVKHRRSPSEPFQIEVLNSRFGLGIVVADDPQGHCVIKKIELTGSAARTGNIRAGDYILSVSGKDVRGESSHTVQEVLNSTPRGIARIILSAKYVEPAGVTGHSVRSPSAHQQPSPSPGKQSSSEPEVKQAHPAPRVRRVGTVDKPQPIHAVGAKSADTTDRTPSAEAATPTPRDFIGNHVASRDIDCITRDRHVMVDTQRVMEKQQHPQQYPQQHPQQHPQQYPQQHPHQHPQQQQAVLATPTPPIQMRMNSAFFTRNQLSHTSSNASNASDRIEDVTANEREVTEPVIKPTTRTRSTRAEVPTPEDSKPADVDEPVIAPTKAVRDNTTSFDFLEAIVPPQKHNESSDSETRRVQSDSTSDSTLYVTTYQKVTDIPEFEPLRKVSRAPVEHNRSTSEISSSSSDSTPLSPRLPPEGKEFPDSPICPRGNQEGDQQQGSGGTSSDGKRYVSSVTLTPTVTPTTVISDKLTPTAKTTEEHTTNSDTAGDQQQKKESVFSFSQPRRSGSLTNLSRIGRTDDSKSVASSLDLSSSQSNMNPDLVTPRSWSSFSERTRRSSVGSIGSAGGDDSSQKSYAPPLMPTRRESLVDQLERNSRMNSGTKLKGLQVKSNRRASTSQIGLSSKQSMPVIGSHHPTGLKPMKAFAPINFSVPPRKISTGEETVDSPKSVAKCKSDAKLVSSSVVNPLKLSRLPSGGEATRTIDEAPEQEQPQPTSTEEVTRLTVNPVSMSRLPSASRNEDAFGVAQQKPATKPHKQGPPVPKKPVVAPKPKVTHRDPYQSQLLRNGKPAETSNSTTSPRNSNTNNRVSSGSDASESFKSPPLSPIAILPKPYKPAASATAPPAKEFSFTTPTSDVKRDYTLNKQVYSNSPRPYRSPTEKKEMFGLKINASEEETAEQKLLSPSSTATTDSDSTADNRYKRDLNDDDKSALGDIDSHSVDSGLYGSKNNLLDGDDKAESDSGRVLSDCGDALHDESVDRSQAASPPFSDQDSGIFQRSSHANDTTHLTTTTQNGYHTPTTTEHHTTSDASSVSTLTSGSGGNTSDTGGLTDVSLTDSLTEGRTTRVRATRGTEDSDTGDRDRKTMSVLERSRKFRESLSKSKETTDDLIDARSSRSVTTTTNSSSSSTIRSRLDTGDGGPASIAGKGVEKTVELTKGPVGLGFCIEGGRGSPKGDVPITVKRLFKGDHAAVGVLEAGDVILAVNHHDYRMLSHFEAWSILKKIPSDQPFTMKLSRK